MENEKRTIDPGQPVQRILDPSDLGTVKSIIDEEKRTIWHPITREVPDRYGDVVRIDGMDAADFLRKPAVLYGHDYRGTSPVTVIGECVGFKKEGDVLYAGTKFLDTSAPGMSQALKDLVNDNWLLHKAGLLGWSIGFLPVDWAEIVEGKQFKGYDFKAWKLLEYSSVIIPAHQDAVNNSVSKGLVAGLTGAILREVELLEELVPTQAPLTKAAEDATVPAAEIELPAPPPAENKDNVAAGEPAGEPEPIVSEPVVLMAGKSNTEEKPHMEKEINTPEPQRHVDLHDGPMAPQVRALGEIMRLPARELTMVEREVQRHVDDCVILGVLTHKDPRTTKLWNGLAAGSALRKAMDTATAGEGLEFVPTALSANFIEDIRQEAKVAALFPDIAMPTNPYKVPYFGGISASNFYSKPEATSDNPSASPASTPATGDQTLTAKGVIANINFSDELDEDSIIPIIPLLRAELAKGAADCVEDMILNGDTTATHMDSDVTDARDRRKLWNGLRDYCPSGTKADLSTFSTANYLALLKLMGKYGLVANDLAVITGPTGIHKFRALSEVLTVDKYGPQATILSGELAKLAGIPIIGSDYIRQNLNASGVYDGSVTTYTQFLIVNRKGFMLGTRGLPKLEFVRDAKVGQNTLVLSFRKAFSPRLTPSATVTTIAMGYKVS